MAAPRRLTRDKLLDVSAELFAQKGYEGTSISDITDALRITRPTLYTHAKSKSELLDAIHERLIEFYEKTSRAYMRPDESPIDRIERVIRLHLDATRHYPFSVRMALNGVRDTSISYSKRLDDWWHEQDLKMEQAIADGQRLELITRDIPVKILKHMFWGVINEIPYWYRPFGPLAAEDVTAQILSFLTGTVGPARRDAALQRKPARVRPFETAQEWRFQMIGRDATSVTTRAQIPPDSIIGGNHQMTAAITSLVVWTCESFFRDSEAVTTGGDWHLEDLSMRLLLPLNEEKLQCVAVRQLSSPRMDIWDVNITRDGDNEPLCITRALFMKVPS